MKTVFELKPSLAFDIFLLVFLKAKIHSCCSIYSTLFLFINR